MEVEWALAYCLFVPLTDRDIDEAEVVHEWWNFLSYFLIDTKELVGTGATLAAPKVLTCWLALAYHISSGTSMPMRARPSVRIVLVACVRVRRDVRRDSGSA